MTPQQLKEAIEKSKLSELEFFQLAYLKRFNKIYNCVRDVCEWRRDGVIPQYVKWYVINHCQ